MADDPTLRNARREAWIIAAAWATATGWSCGVSYALGYGTPARPLGPGDVRPTLGMPGWFFWGVIVPWAACGVFTVVFAGWFMVDDDLGLDRAEELDRDIRDGGPDEPA